MPCRLNEIPFMYFGRLVLERLEKEGIKITDSIVSSIYNFLSKYKLEINEKYEDKNFLSEIYSKVKEKFGLKA